MSEGSRRRLAGPHRRFEAIVMDWDGTAVADRRSDASVIRQAIERASAAGLHISIVSGTQLANVDGQLAARPRGPGTLHLCLNRGSEVFTVTRNGPVLLRRRRATRAQEQQLDRAAEATVDALTERGLDARVVSTRLNRRKIDLIPVAEWRDPPKAHIAQLEEAVHRRLEHAGIAGLIEAVRLARGAAHDAALADARVTTDAKHVEIGLTDKSDSMQWIVSDLWRRGIGVGQILVLGDEFGGLGGVPGSDSLMITGDARRSCAVSVGVEPSGVPAGVVHLGGGPDACLGLILEQCDRRTCGELPLVEPGDGWGVERAGATDDEAAGALFALTDGRIGTVGAPLHADHLWSRVLMTGMYEGDGPMSQLLACPVWHSLSGGESLGVERRVLDMHAGVLACELAGTAAQPSGALLFVSLARPGTGVLRAGLLPDGPAITPPSPSAGAHEMDRGCVDSVDWMRVRPGGGGGVVAAASQRRVGPTGAMLDRVATYRGSTVRVPSARSAVQAARRVAGQGFDTLLAEHRARWAARWRDADIEIAGDDALQQAVRFALFHLIAAAPDRGDGPVGARGLTGAGYRGHVFWDADVFVLPFLAATHPAAARAMLEYRIRRLPAAARRADTLRRRGARFAWESAATGDDVTPGSVRDLRTGELRPIRTGELEEHIVADVAWGAACYVDWSGDDGFWARGGAGLLIETARYWASRVRSDTDGRAHIYGVIGPDEYHEPVDDNAFTNVMARWNLRAAAELAGRSQLAPPSERREWLEIAAVLVDGYERSTGVYEQFAGFNRLEDLLIADVAPTRPVAADLLLGPERVAGSQVIKQADVLMLHYLVPDEVEPRSLQPNLTHYEPRTAHGSSLSPGVHAALLAQAGHGTAAMDALRLAARIDLDDLTGTTATGLHLAAMGTVWRALVTGVLGVWPHGGSLAVDPRLPREIPRLKASVRFRGARVEVEATQGHLRITSGRPTLVTVDGIHATATARGVEFEQRNGGWAVATR